MSEPKESRWKGQSRVLKVCHWCAKKQNPVAKPFQACSRCKEVIYCSKECQVASWPLHKGACKLNVQSKARATENPAMAQAIGNFKKWHGSHVDALRHAAICALDLGNKPLAIDDHVLFVEIKLKFEHANLPPNKKYEPVAGFIMSMEETTGLLRQNGGAEILDGVKAANLHMRQKGGLGVATILMKAHDVVDVVKVLLPSPTAAKIAQAADDWGEFWVQRLRLAVI